MQHHMQSRRRSYLRTTDKEIMSDGVSKLERGTQAMVGVYHSEIVMNVVTFYVSEEGARPNYHYHCKESITGKAQWSSRMILASGWKHL